MEVVEGVTVLVLLFVLVAIQGVTLWARLTGRIGEPGPRGPTGNAGPPGLSGRDGASWADSLGRDHPAQVEPMV